MRFMLNDKEVDTDLPLGTLLLDYVRYHRHLTGTKIGCREGDCGACTVLIGELTNGSIRYRSATSCLTALGNLAGKHIVTIEGLNLDKPNAIQKAMCEEGASQCGFCTPGFVVSFAGFCLVGQTPSYGNAIAAIDGNICRCTGYKSIERAAAKIAIAMQANRDADTIDFLTKNNILPAYFTTVADHLAKMPGRKDDIPVPYANGIPFDASNHNGATIKKILGGGTDLYVQQHDTMVHADILFLFDKGSMHAIVDEGDTCMIGGSATVSDLLASPAMLQRFPRLPHFAKLVSSTPIRNIATIAGNFINASPIGDFTIFFLALDATITLTDGFVKRLLPLRQLYVGYKQLDKRAEEYIGSIRFHWPQANSYFHFEKVSKRTHLDIASVNTAIHITMDGDTISKASLSAGGVGPVPMFLAKTSAFLRGKTPGPDLLDEIIGTAQTEISPISDARGTEAYKRLLLSQLIKVHFLKLFPERLTTLV